MLEKRDNLRAGFWLVVIATALASCVVMLGAFTRLVDAGLGCPDWPVCYGHILWPNEPHEILAANEKFPDTPVETDKTWPEQVHRLFASSLGLFCIAIVVVALVQRYRRGDSSYPLIHPLLLLIVVIVQGLFGMWTVTLNLWPQVVTAHLLGGFTTLSLLALLAWRLGGGRWRLTYEQQARLAPISRLALMATFFVFLQIALGGWLTSNYAALACPDFPLCHNALLPAMDFAQGFDIAQTIGPNYLGGMMESDARTAIHFSHRVGALIVTILLIVLGIRLLRSSITEAVRWGWVIWFILAVQLALGVSNVVFSLPLAVAVAHNAVGATLLVAMVALCYRLLSVKTNPNLT